MEALFFANIQGGFFSFVVPLTVSGPDLAVSKAPSVRTLVVPGAMTYTLSINNYGTGSATGVVVTDQLPANISLVAATSNRGEVCPLAERVRAAYLPAPADFGRGCRWM